MARSATRTRTCPQCGAGLSWPDYADMAVCPSCGSTLVADARLRAAECPQCAGPLAAVGGTRLLGCCHCGVQVLVAATEGIDRRRLPLRVDPPAAERAARGWLGGRRDVVREAKQLPFMRVELFYLPIWEYSAIVAGWEFGYRSHLEERLVGEEGYERLELTPVREAVQDGHLQQRRFYEPAARPEAIGATRPRVSGREPLLPLLAGDLDGARVPPIEGTAAGVRGEGRAEVLQPVAVDADAGSRLFALRETVSLLFYPLWLLAFEYQARPYRVVVNGFDGSVNAALAPAAALARLRGRFSSDGGRTGEVEYHDLLSC